MVRRRLRGRRSKHRRGDAGRDRRRPRRRHRGRHQPTTRLRSVDLVDGRMVSSRAGCRRTRSHTVVRVPEGPDDPLRRARERRDDDGSPRGGGTLVAGRVYYATVGARRAASSCWPSRREARRGAGPQGRISRDDAAGSDGSAADRARREQAGRHRADPPGGATCAYFRRWTPRAASTSFRRATASSVVARPLPLTRSIQA